MKPVRENEMKQKTGKLTVLTVLLLTVCIAAGALLLLAGIFKLGRLISFVPMPVIISLSFRQSLCYDSVHITSIFPQTQRQCYRRTDKPQPLQYHHLLGNFLLVLPKN